LNKHKSTLENHKDEHNLIPESSEEDYKKVKTLINEWEYEDEFNELKESYGLDLK